MSTGIDSQLDELHDEAMQHAMAAGRALSPSEQWAVFDERVASAMEAAFADQLANFDGMAYGTSEHFLARPLAAPTVFRGVEVALTGAGLIVPPKEHELAVAFSFRTDHPGYRNVDYFALHTDGELELSEQRALRFSNQRFMRLGQTLHGISRRAA